MKVGIAIPCHEDDLPIFRNCRESLCNLNPQPYRVAIDVNKGNKSLMEIRQNLFEGLYALGCDVVLQCSADFYLFPHILRHVSTREVVTFTNLNRRRWDLFFTLHGLLLRNRSWTGCYSIPRDLWFDLVRDQFDGTDSSVAKAVGRWKVKALQYYALRPYDEENTRKLLASFPFWKRVLWQLVRMKAVRLRS